MARPPGVIRWLGSIRAASRPFFGKKRITRGKRSRRWTPLHCLVQRKTIHQHTPIHKTLNTKTPICMLYMYRERASAGWGVHAMIIIILTASNIEFQILFHNRWIHIRLDRCVFLRHVVWQNHRLTVCVWLFNSIDQFVSFSHWDVEGECIHSFILFVVFFYHLVCFKVSRLSHTLNNPTEKWNS